MTRYDSLVKLNGALACLKAAVAQIEGPVSLPMEAALMDLELVEIWLGHGLFWSPGRASRRAAGGGAALRLAIRRWRAGAPFGAAPGPSARSGRGPSPKPSRSSSSRRQSRQPQSPVNPADSIAAAVRRLTH